MPYADSHGESVILTDSHRFSPHSHDSHLSSRARGGTPVRIVRIEKNWLTMDHVGSLEFRMSVLILTISENH